MFDEIQIFYYKFVFQNGMIELKFVYKKFNENSSFTVKLILIVIHRAVLN